MNSTENSVGQFEIVSISDLATLDKPTLTSAIETYQQAFAAEPYNEAFSSEEAKDALEYILIQSGDLMLGKLGNKAVSLAGGFMKPDGTYYVEELAVNPSKQGNGYGRSTLNELLAVAQKRNPVRLEIRTAATNRKAIELYESTGFSVEVGTEVVAQSRQNGEIRTDERLYMSKPPRPEQERQSSLKRAAIAYPSGNTTAVVFDQLPGVDREALNTRVMEAWKRLKPDQPEIEQCCFVTLPRNPDAMGRVEMFGGEFCGNATRSVIWLLSKGQNCAGLIEVSGEDRPLRFRVRDGNVTVEMPLPQSGELVRPVKEGDLVQLDGIAQLVVTKPQDGQSARQLLMSLLKENKYKLNDQPAVGITYYDPTSSKAEFCVWVKAVNTIFDETACGSGTCAIAIAQAQKELAAVTLKVIQPSGETIQAEVVYQADTPMQSSITGTVDVLYDGELKLQ